MDMLEHPLASVIHTFLVSENGFGVTYQFLPFFLFPEMNSGLLDFYRALFDAHDFAAAASAALLFEATEEYLHAAGKDCIWVPTSQLIKDTEIP
ncbi:MAG: hypothetical protein U5N53_22800 [Mycobacterium sp.]|nr:hypothetical protein [Mycobacterium sp.]